MEISPQNRFHSIC